jgi:hypothetical protein
MGAIKALSVEDAVIPDMFESAGSRKAFGPNRDVPPSMPGRFRGFHQNSEVPDGRAESAQVRVESIKDPDSLFKAFFQKKATS